MKLLLTLFVSFSMITAQAEHGCSLTATITPSGPTTFCKFDHVILQANTGASYSYQWMRNDEMIPGATGSSFTASKSGNYTVQITDGACVDVSDAVSVTVNPAPAANISTPATTNDLCVHSPIKLRANNGSGFFRQWYKDGELIPGATVTNYFVSSPGSYQVEVTAGGCSRMSEPFVIINSCREEMQDVPSPLSVYPNPAKDVFHITSSNDISGIIIYNLNGDVILKQGAESNDILISCRDMQAGIYVGEILFSNGAAAFEKIVVQK